MSEDGSIDAETTQWSDWEEEDECMLCLFCSETFTSLRQCVYHIHDQHQVDMVHALKDVSFYDRIKLVNWVRHEVAHNGASAAVKDQWRNGDIPAAVLSSETFLKPTMADDALLLHLDDDELLAISMPTAYETQDEKEPDYEKMYFDLVQHFQALQTIAKDRLFQGSPTTADENAEGSLRNSNNNNKEEDADGAALDYYFSSYSHLDIHESMLKDRVRTSAFRDFIYDNKHLFEGKRVLDVGCGTGILSMFAVKAGASHVIAVDNSSMIEHAKRIAAKNGCGDRIEFRRGKMEDMVLDGPVDIILSEWQGYWLLFEGMFDTVIHARQRWLKPDGVLVPGTARMFLAGLDDAEYYNDKVGYWENVYGFDMTEFQPWVLKQAIVDEVPDEAVATSAAQVACFDANTVTVPELEFEADFELKSLRAAELFGLCGWFDIDMGGARLKQPKYHPVCFSTGPHAPWTHWKQTVFLFERPLDIKADSIVQGHVVCRKSKQNHRNLHVELTCKVTDANGNMDERSQTYSLE